MSININSRLIIDGSPVNTWEEMTEAYRKRIEEHGLGHKSLFYPNEALHTAKLAHIARILNLEIEATDTVLDVGCGTGDIIPFMPACTYRGIDLVPEFVKEARKRHPDLQFDRANVLDIETSFEWVILLGMMGTVPLPEELIEKAWLLASKGIIVDFIDVKKYQGYLNTYRLGECTETFLSMGAQRIKLYPTPRHNWTFFVVYKRSLWL